MLRSVDGSGTLLETSVVMVSLMDGRLVPMDGQQTVSLSLFGGGRERGCRENAHVLDFFGACSTFSATAVEASSVVANNESTRTNLAAHITSLPGAH